MLTTFCKESKENRLETCSHERTTIAHFGQSVTNGLKRHNDSLLSLVEPEGGAVEPQC